MEIRKLKSTIRNRCDLPDGWDVHEQADGYTLEVSGYSQDDGIAKRVIEVVYDQSGGFTEVTILHVDMPGRIAAGRMERGLDVDEYVEIPSKMGSLKFENADAAIRAICELAQQSVLDAIVEKRDFVQGEGTPFKTAVLQETDIDVESTANTQISV